MMPTEADVVALFERANPVPDLDVIDIAVTADQRLADVLRDDRTAVTVVDDTTAADPPPRRRRWMIPAAAAAILVVALGAVLSIVGRDETEPSDSVPPTIPPAPTTTLPDESAAEPRAADLAVVDAFFTAYNSGDTDEVLALLADGAVVSEFDPEEPYVDWDQRLAWNLGQGEVLTEPSCELGPDQPAEGATLFCTYETLDAVVLAVDGADPIPTSTYFTVVDNELTVVDQRYGFPDFATLGTPFTRWMEQNHPEVTAALFHGWTSREEAVEHGLLRAEWAQEWARSLGEPEDAAVVLEGPPTTPPLTAAADGETQESIVGDITWTRVDGDASSQPRDIEFFLEGQYYGSDDGGRITWRSPDAVSWTKIDAVEHLDTIVETGDDLWAVRFDRRRDDTVLARSNGTSFVPVELPRTTAPDVDGFISSGRRLSLAPSGDQVAVVVHEGFLVNWTDYLGFGDWLGAEPNGDGAIRVRNVRAGSSVQLDVIADETERGRVHLYRDHELIASIGPWPGLDAESLIMPLDGLWHNELMIGDDSGFELTPLPAIDRKVIDVATLGERLLLLGRSSGRDGDFELWAGTPGTAWERLAPPAPGGAVVDHVSMAARDGSVLLTVASGEDGEILEAWHTSDGETWRASNGGASQWNGVVGTIQPTDFGWARSNAFDVEGVATVSPDGVAVSPDGVVWQEITVVIPEGRDFSEHAVATLGDIIVFSWFDDFGDRTMLVGRVDAD